jgi:Fur family transcriptional regulator, ferric uptake regulator
MGTQPSHPSHASDQATKLTQPAGVGAPATPVVPVAPVADAALAQARRLVSESGGRNTEARRNVLACLIAANRALSHGDIETQLAGTDLDRVTLYRVLDWLVEHALAHRVGNMGGHERAMRFAFTHPEKPNAHAHFQCTECGRTICLEDVAAPALNVPVGIELQGIELSAFGRCASCQDSEAAKS